MKRHGRRSMRLRGYDYSRNGAYFITICTCQRRRRFGEVVDGKMRLSRAGEIAHDEWRRSAAIRQEVILDAWVIMPDHMHGIVIIDHCGGDLRSPAMGRPPAIRWSPATATGPRPKSIGALVGGFKSATTRRIRMLYNTPGTRVWQRNYHDSIIRSAPSLNRIREYIRANPANWAARRHSPRGSTGDRRPSPPAPVVHQREQAGAVPRRVSGSEP